MANYCKISNEVFFNIRDDVFDNMENVINLVTSNLPKSFPAEMAQIIFNEMRMIKNRKNDSF